MEILWLERYSPSTAEKGTGQGKASSIKVNWAAFSPIICFEETDRVVRLVRVRLSVICNLQSARCKGASKPGGQEPRQEPGLIRTADTVMYEEGNGSRPRNPQRMMDNREDNPCRTGQVLFVWDRAESPAWRWAMGHGSWIMDQPSIHPM